MVCPAAIELDKKIESDMLAKQEWIAVKKDIGEIAHKFKNPHLYGEQVADTVSFEVEKINLYGDTLGGTPASLEEWYTSYYQTIYTAFTCG